jgi:UPF0716 protein FxsA
MAKWIVIGILALPAAEIALFILVAAKIGFLHAFGLLIATSVTGLIVLRHAGRAQMQRLRVAVTQSDIAELQAGGEAILTVLAGILLLLPGFITAVVGIMLLIAPVGRWIGRRMERFIRTSRSHQPAGVVDLGREEWSQVPEQAPDDPPAGRSPPAFFPSPK